jgi:hypothetical protein
MIAPSTGGLLCDFLTNVFAEMDFSNAQIG